MKQANATQTESELESLFVLMGKPAESGVVAQCVEITKHASSIRALAEITEQVERPYIGSYLSA